MTSRIKILGRMDVVEKRRPQDGRIKTRMPDGEEIELRLSTLPTAHGEKLVMRIFDPEVLQRDFKELGFTTEEHEIWQNLIKQPGGILLVTGPTGSGKTTTLYTTLKQLATPEVNVCTIEDPIEMVDPTAEPDAGADRRSTSRSPRACARSCARTRTSSWSARSATSRPPTWPSRRPSPATWCSRRCTPTTRPRRSRACSTWARRPTCSTPRIIGIMAQRLVRTLCPHCKEKVPFQREEEHRALGTRCARPSRPTPPEQVYRPVGCLECRKTGYLGRIGIYEIMPMTREIKHLIQEKTDMAALTAGGLQGGDAAAARLGRDQGRAGRHHVRGGLQVRTVGLSGSLRSSTESRTGL